MIGGILGALAAAVPGFVDLLSLRGAVKRTAIAFRMAGRQDGL